MARWTCVQHKKKVDDDNRFENEMEIRVRLHLEEVSHKYGKDLRSNNGGASDDNQFDDAYTYYVEMLCI